MALSYSTMRQMPYLPTYEAASRYEASVKPIRGDADQTKPLGRRDQKYRLIKRDPVTGCIEIRHGWMAKKSLISYHPDGTISVYGPTYWNKATDGDIINSVLGWSWRSQHGQMWISTQTGWHPLKKGEMNAFKPTIERKVNHLGAKQRHIAETITDIPTMVAPVTTVRHLINKDGKKAVLTRLAKFREYAEAMVKLRVDDNDAPPRTSRNSIVTNDELCDTFGFTEHSTYNNVIRRYPNLPAGFSHWVSNLTRADVEAIYNWALSDDATDQYKAFLAVFNHKYAETQQDAFDNLHRVLERVAMMHCPEECLTPVTCEPGKIVRDKYAWALRP